MRGETEKIKTAENYHMTDKMCVRNQTVVREINGK